MEQIEAAAFAEHDWGGDPEAFLDRPSDRPPVEAFDPYFPRPTTQTESARRYSPHFPDGRPSTRD